MTEFKQIANANVQVFQQLAQLRGLARAEPLGKLGRQQRVQRALHVGVGAPVELEIERTRLGRPCSCSSLPIVPEGAVDSPRSEASRWAICSREPNSSTERPRLMMSPKRRIRSWISSPLTFVPLVLSRSVITSLS